MKDLSIFERVFALRDEAREAQLGADAPDPPKPRRDTEGREIAPSLPRGELAAALMKRAVALHKQAIKSEAKRERSTNPAIAQLLRSASTRLRDLDESDLVAADAAPAPAPKRAAPRRKRGGGTPKKK